MWKKKRGEDVNDGSLEKTVCQYVLGTCEFRPSSVSIQTLCTICSQQNSKNSHIISRVCLCVCNIHKINLKGKCEY